MAKKISLAGDAEKRHPKLVQPGGVHRSGFDLIMSFNELTGSQFDVWIESLNIAVRRSGGMKVFTRDDRDKTISYWYLLGRMVAELAKVHDVFDDDYKVHSEIEIPLSVHDLSQIFKDRYAPETIRRYVGDLKKFHLLNQEGRGAEVPIRISNQAAFAYTNTVRRWIEAFQSFVTELSALSPAFVQQT